MVRAAWDEVTMLSVAAVYTLCGRSKEKVSTTCNALQTRLSVERTAVQQVFLQWLCFTGVLSIQQIIWQIPSSSHNSDNCFLQFHPLIAWIQVFASIKPWYSLHQVDAITLVALNSANALNGANKLAWAPGPPESSTQTSSRSAQPLLHSSEVQWNYGVLSRQSLPESVHNVNFGLGGQKPEI